ncbi:abortive infection family protein [Kitasatospora purpeofusca]|uniref:abortive infection family protein n=1 Tax=Kitasatospora purpeofusca TaxID=67352 RepID=UPI003F4A996C
MAPQQGITEVTRRRVFDTITLEEIAWAGRLDEDDFLRRIYDLEAMVSYDSRFANARGDIVQHRFNNHDWDDDWVLTDDRFELLNGSDSTFLRFLAEMLHPVVRPDKAQVDKLLHTFNALLAADGYELVQDGAISGLPLFKGVRNGSFHGDQPQLQLESRRLLTDPRVLHEHLVRIRDGLQKDPAAAIASSKELLESLCKVILGRSGVEYTNSDELPVLYRKVAELLSLKAESVPDSAKGSESAQKILRTLVTTVQTLGELRNQLGLGHGRAAPSPAFTRHARLALNSAVAVTEFLLDTWEERVDRGLLTLDDH